VLEFDNEFMFGSIRFLILLCYLLFVSPNFDETTTLPFSTRAADFFMNLSRVMARPHLWVRSKAFRLYSPMIPGQYGQSPSKTKEMLERGVWLESLTSIAPFAFITGQLSTVPRYLSYVLRKTPYHHLRGEASPISTDKMMFSFFDLNICFLPGELPQLFGGVSSIPERIDPLIELIKSVDADVICLYEVFEVDAAYILFEKLKDQYYDFYIDIGPDLLDFNSGLFVASKYKLKDPHFKAFNYPHMQEEMKKGYFDFLVMSNDQIKAHFYTTHLQPYRKAQDEVVREAELNEILSAIKTAEQENVSYPVILCGDMNIPWGTEEYTKSSLFNNKILHNAYLQGKIKVDKNNRTYTSYMEDFRFNNVGALLMREEYKTWYSEVIDYVLLYNKTDKMEVSTIRVDAFDTDNPETAISDHHGLYTTVKIHP